ncbi:AAA family ATPase [Pseudoramibacter alactolyticus]
MLLEFKAKNYKSFKDELIFSMIPAPKQKGLDYSILRERIGKHTYKGLSSAIIYGSNASGKTNIIGAMDTFKNIVLRGNIRNDEKDTPNPASAALELIPNNICKDSEPVEFSIKFIEKDMVVEYAFSMDIGTFLDLKHDRKVVKEYLKINDKLLFDRGEKLEICSLDLIENYLVKEFEEHAEGVIAIAKNNLNDKELFLTNGFKNMFSAKIVNLILDWLDNKFMVIYRANSMQLIRKFVDPKEKSVYIEKTINEAAELFGINSNALGYMTDSESKEARLSSLFDKEGSKGTAIPAEVFESYGTIRFVNMFPLVVNALLNGGTLIVDEFDASIHPMALMNIINIFHNDEINKKHAQLVFNTHNPIFLNANLFRRDEIKFVERDDDTHCSSHYSLSDFGTSGKGGVRKNEDYMKNYFVDRYGAIKDIDFTPIFENLLKDRNEV